MDEGGFDRGFEFLEFGTDGIAGAGGVGVDDGGVGAGEDAVEGVEVGLADGVELVIVAAGAAHGEGLEGLRDGVDLVVGEGDHLIERIDRREAMQHHTKLRDADGAFVEAVLQAWLRQEITSSFHSINHLTPSIYSPYYRDWETDRKSVV